ncbi:MAG TPA: phage holin family protein [Gaiellaceae bacterium]|jgi:hypothetical protein
MPTHAGNGVGAAARSVAEHASALARLELQLAGLEVKRKLGSLALGIGMLIAAAVLGLFVLGFGLAAGAAGIATVLPTWAALLIVAGALAGLASLLGLLGLRLIRKGAPPVPEQAIAEARKTTEALRSDGRE